MAARYDGRGVFPVSMGRVPVFTLDRELGRLRNALQR